MAVAYPVDQRDSVVALAELPTPTAGAGEPTLLANEDTLRIAYYVYGGDDAVALVVFSGVEAHYFGPPHVDAVDRHPLHSRGVDIYGAFEVHDSSWIRDLRHAHRGASFHSHVSRHHIRVHRPRLYDIDAQEKSDRGYPQYGGTVGLNQTLQSDAGALSPLVTPSGVEESLKTCHWKHQEMSGVRST